eukprot:7380389-Prymnesium_polylepis.2
MVGRWCKSGPFNPLLPQAPHGHMNRRLSATPAHVRTNSVPAQSACRALPWGLFGALPSLGEVVHHLHLRKLDVALDGATRHVDRVTL